jgi:hypothetical protein
VANPQKKDEDTPDIAPERLKRFVDTSVDHWKLDEKTQEAAKSVTPEDVAGIPVMSEEEEKEWGEDEEEEE